MSYFFSSCTNVCRYLIWNVLIPYSCGGRANHWLEQLLHDPKNCQSFPGINCGPFHWAAWGWPNPRDTANPAWNVSSFRRSETNTITVTFQHFRFYLCDIQRCFKSDWTRCFPSPTPASESRDSCRLIVESIHREGSLKPAAHACAPSLERVACRAAWSLIVRVASVLYVHVCLPMCTCMAVKDTERGRKCARTPDLTC